MGHQASHDFLGAAKLQSAPGADNPRYAAEYYSNTINTGCLLQMVAYTVQPAMMMTT